MICLSHAPDERRNYYRDEALSALRALGEVRLNETGAPLAGDAFAEAAAGCAVIVGDIKATPTREVFAALPDLVAYVHGHVDMRRIDIAGASAEGVLVTRASAGFGPAVSELILGFMIDLTRGITASTLAWRNGAAPQTALSCQLMGRTIGIVGYGHIGRRLAAVAATLGINRLVYDPYVTVPAEDGLRQVSLAELLAEADFVVPLAVATPETRNLIDADALAQMKPTAFLINVSRGDLVDEDALEDALERKAIAGAALDVGLAPFQMPPARLASRPDVLATPHVGGLTPEANRHQAMETVRQVAAILNGEWPQGAVNRDDARRFRAFAAQS